MEDLLEKYADIIEDWGILKENKNDYHLLQISIRFKNGTRLEIKDKFLKVLRKRNYSYQYMQSDNTLIIRWDNAPHPHNVSTMPHHKHVGEETNIQPSEAMNLQKVLLFIGKVLGIFAILTLTAWLIKS